MNGKSYVPKLLLIVLTAVLLVSDTGMVMAQTVVTNGTALFNVSVSAPSGQLLVS
jgi:hypothetical protein